MHSSGPASTQSPALELRGAAPATDALEVQRLVAETKARLLGDRQPVRLGRYEITRWLGTGAFGTVYACVDPSMQREVAVKILHVSAQHGRALDDALLREARAQARVEHPNVVGVLDVGRVDGRAFVVMALLPGGDLRAWTKVTQPSSRLVVEAIVDAGRGLAAAHAVGLVHCDVKATNLLRSSSGRVSVADFGVATLPGGARGGTPATMSPEQRLGQPLDGRADQFSLALVAVEMLAGHLPAVPSREAVRGVPPRLASVLGRALQTQRERRYASMDDFVQALVAASQPRRPVARVAAMTLVALGVAVVAMQPARQDVSAHASSEPAPLQVRARAPELEAVARLIDTQQLDAAAASLAAILARDPAALDDWARAEATYLYAKAAISHGQDELARGRYSTAHGLAVASGNLQIAVESAGNLAGAHAEVGDRPAAERWLAQMRAEVERAGRPDAYLGAYWLTAAGIHQSAGRQAEAIDAGQRAVELLRGTRSGPPERLATALRGLGLALFLAGRFSEAEGPLREALQGLTERFGPQDPRRGPVLDVLAAVLVEQGRPHDALPIAKQATDLLIERYGEGHPAVQAARINLAQHWLALDQAEQAVAILQGVLDALDPADLMADRARIELAQALRTAGRLEEARPWAVQAAVAMESNAMHAPGEAGHAYVELAEIEAAAGDRDAAGRAWNRAGEIFRDAGRDAEVALAVAGRQRLADPSSDAL